REQLTFLEEAQAMRELLRETGMTQDALARRLGRSPSSVANLLRLLRLPEAVRRTVGEEKLTERHARALLKLDGDEKAQLDAVRRITRGQLNVRQTDALIEGLLRERRAASRKVKGVVRDARMFVNAISGTVEKLRKAGVNAALRVEETSESVEILVTFRKGVREG
ncbi:MAG: ParB/RepB/Spo0J family partition protein, partial [Clostridia bacterium]|nr:ParB/RepB/Spo0J family partition protein [Clostridia bacterium]